MARRHEPSRRIAEAVRSEAEAWQRLREARRAVALAVADGVEAGRTFDDLARTALRARMGRAPSIEERKRETERLRQLHRRANSCHARVGGTVASRSITSTIEAPEVTNMERLIKRTVTEEFVDTKKADAVELDDVDRDDLDEADGETDPPRRRSR